MKLTKEQIQEIDQRLKRRGIKYWDLRIEMIDHIISDIEQNAKTNNFKVELENSLRRIGWSGSLRNVNQEGWQSVSKKYGREYNKYIRAFFKSPLNLLLLTASVLIYYFVSEYFSFKFFKVFSVSLFTLPIIPFLFFSIKQAFKKYGRSVNLDYGSFYFSFAFLIINMPVQFMEHFSESNQKLMFIVLIPLYYIATFSGYKIYKKTINKVEKMKNEMAL